MIYVDLAVKGLSFQPFDYPLIFLHRQSKALTPKPVCIGYLTANGYFAATHFFHVHSMNYITRKVVLATLTKHETLTIDDLSKEENLGLVPDQNQLNFLLRQLAIGGYILSLKGVTPLTYTITNAGIEENDRLVHA
jgi:hypothetical protein